jgi:hypothetical protein
MASYFTFVASFLIVAAVIAGGV